MVLHPASTVSTFMSAHSTALGLVHGCLDFAVADAYARWSDQYAPRELHGAVLSASVRTLLLRKATGLLMQDASLSISEGSNCAAHLWDPTGTRVRVRKRPINWKTLAPQGLTEPPVDTLFGVDMSAAPFELAVLWSPDLKTKSLGSAALVAVAALDKPADTVIYAEEPLPIATVTFTKQDLVDNEPLDDFDEYLNEEGQDTGDDPA